MPHVLLAEFTTNLQLVNESCTCDSGATRIGFVTRQFSKRKLPVEPAPNDVGPEYGVSSDSEAVRPGFCGNVIAETPAPTRTPPAGTASASAGCSAPNSDTAASAAHTTPATLVAARAT